jgi:cysteine desulfurase/selenocysteine lyase
VTPATGATSVRMKPVREGAAAVYEVQRVRQDFPILQQRINGRPLVYLDNAATSQKPRAVLESLQAYYTECNSNVHRGLHQLSERATEAYEQARAKAQRFLNASDSREIIFVRGTTEAINLVAHSYGRENLKPGDEVLISAMEHHSNIVPWQMVCQQTGAVLRVCPMNDRGELLLDEYRKLLSSRTRIVAFTHVSNALGTINPVKQMVKMAHEAGAVALIDGAQAAPHLTIDVRDLECDFYAMSGHKMYGPTGIGVLYGTRGLLDAMPPYQGGGEMIKSVTFEKTIYNDLPHKFEAGTPHIAGAIGLGAAIDYLNILGLDRIAAHEHELLAYGTRALASVPGIRFIGAAAHKAAVLSFTLEGVHPHDIGTILDHEGIAIRSGHHCAQPVMDRFGLPATARASLGLYNTKEEIDALVAALGRVNEVFG